MKQWAYYYKQSTGKYIQVHAKKAHYLVKHQGWSNRFYAFPRPNSIEVFVKQNSNRTHFYSFFSDKDRLRYQELGGGESRAHYLFKTVLCEVERITLKCSNWDRDVAVTFSNMHPEKHIVHEGNSFYIDVYGNFESEDPLRFKWGPKIGIEIFNTNEVYPTKRRALKALDIPIIEHKISDLLRYKGPENYQDEQREESYKRRLKNKLNNGFLWVNIVSGPKSFEYLKWENRQLYSQLNDTNTKLTKIQKEQQETQESLNDAIHEKNGLASEIRDKNARISNLETEALHLNSEINRNKSTITEFFNMGWKDLFLFKLRRSLPNTSNRKKR